MPRPPPDRQGKASQGQARRPGGGSPPFDAGTEEPATRDRVGPPSAPSGRPIDGESARTRKEHQTGQRDADGGGAAPGEDEGASRAVFTDRHRPLSPFASGRPPDPDGRAQMTSDSPRYLRKAPSRGPAAGERDAARPAGMGTGRLRPNLPSRPAASTPLNVAPDAQPVLRRVHPPRRRTGAPDLAPTAGDPPATPRETEEAATDPGLPG